MIGMRGVERDGCWKVELRRAARLLLYIYLTDGGDSSCIRHPMVLCFIESELVRLARSRPDMAYYMGLGKQARAREATKIVEGGLEQAVMMLEVESASQEQ